MSVAPASARAPWGSTGGDDARARAGGDRASLVSARRAKEAGARAAEAERAAALAALASVDNGLSRPPLPLPTGPPPLLTALVLPPGMRPAGPPQHLRVRGRPRARHLRAQRALRAPRDRTQSYIAA